LPDSFLQLSVEGVCDVLCCRFTLQAEEVQARMGRQSSELTTAIASAKEREAEAVRQLREAETKLCEAVQRDERWVVVFSSWCA
jgi:hypothetical protein